MVRGPVSLWSALEGWPLNPHNDGALIPLQGFSPTPQAAYRDVLAAGPEVSADPSGYRSP